MTEKAIVVNKMLDTRNAALFVQTASRFKSDVRVEIADKKVNAKSLMCLISLGISPDTEIKVLAEGADEVDAVEEIAKILA